MRRLTLALVLLAMPCAVRAQCAGGSCAIPSRGFSYGYRYAVPAVPMQPRYVVPAQPRVVRRSVMPDVYNFDPTPGYIWVWSPVGWRQVRTR